MLTYIYLCTHTYVYMVLCHPVAVLYSLGQGAGVLRNITPRVITSR